MGLTDLGFRLTQLGKTLSGLICFVFSSQTDKVHFSPSLWEQLPVGGWGNLSLVFMPGWVWEAGSWREMTQQC